MTEYKGYPGSNQFTDNESLKKNFKRCIVTLEKAQQQERSV